MKTVKLLLIFTLLIILTCCGKTSVGKSKDKAIILCSGLGGSQLNDVQTFINSTYPDIRATQLATWDDYKSNIVANVDLNNYDKIILVGHSFGCDTIAHSSFLIPKIDLVILIDPVATDWGNLTLAPTIEKAVVFRRTDAFGPVRADISGTMSIDRYNISGGHNDIPHDSSIFPIIKTAIDDVLDN